MSWFKIFSAVVVGNLVSWLLISILGLVFWVAAMDATTEALFGSFDSRFKPSKTPQITSQLPPPSPSHNPVSKTASQTDSSQRPVRERERTDPSVIRTNRQMCEFWTAEYRKDRSEQSRSYRDAACARFRASLN